MRSGPTLRPCARDGAQTLLVLSAMFVYLRGWERHFSVPLRVREDSLMIDMFAKATLGHGWWWTNPSPSALSGFDALAFPSNSHVDHVLICVMRWFTADALSCVDLT